jgi:phage terminase large subunit GpA-like protein
MAYETLEQLVAETAEAVQPTRRLSVVDFGREHRWLNVPNSYVGPFLWDKTPYMIEPAEVLTSREFTSMIFAGPARTGKSDVLMNWIGQTAISDPTSMMIIHMTQSVARDWSQGDLRKFFRDNPAVGELLAPGRQNRNTHDITFRSGMRVLVKWPSITELSGKTIQRLWLADYDRMPTDVEKEGAAFDLAKKRATTFKRNGMTVAESSPGFEISDPKWRPKASAPHEAPPVSGGVLPLYNQGDRRRWQWKCPQCGERFEPSFELIDYPKSEDKMEAAEQAVLVCPHDGFPITGDMKYELNLGGIWVPEGMYVDAHGQLRGKRIRTDSATFWLKGPAAGLTTNPGFQDIVLKYLTAMETYKKTLAEESLKNVTNLDLGEPYLPKALASAREPDFLQERAEDWGTLKEEPTVPIGARFLIATVDVQAGSRSSFVVQVHAFGEGMETWFVDMFKIRKSERLDTDGDPMMIDPAAYLEDWKLLIPQVLEKTYLLADGSGRHMAIKAVGCDSGGKEGVTTKAYDFWRSLRDDPDRRKHNGRFHLLKGVGTLTAQSFRIGYPDSNQTGKNAVAKGDVPVCFLNSNQWKDTISGMLQRKAPGEGYVHFPFWAEEWLYSQLTTEIRVDNKGWQNPSRRKNEAWDCFYYAVALLKHPTLSYDRIDWTRPPVWAEEWDKNSLVFSGDTSDVFKKPAPKKTLRELGERLT